MLFIDGISDKALKLFSTGFFAGLTTNPSILKRDRPEMNFRDSLSFLNKISGLHFVQGSVENLNWLSYLREKSKEINPEKFVIKLPWEPLKCAEIVSDIKKLGFKICATAVYTVNQYYLAEISETDYVAVYFDRMKQSGMNPFKLIKNILSIKSSNPKAPRLLVASIKSVEDANEILIAGADDLTLPPKVASDFLKGTFPMKDFDKFEQDFKF